MQALLLAVPVVTAAALAANAAPVVPLVSVEPVVLLQDGRISGCGLSSTAELTGVRVIGEVIAFRDGEQTAFAVRARASEGAAHVKSVRLATASHDTLTLFPPPSPLAPGGVETRAILEGLPGSLFAQELLVTGGRFQIDFDDGQTLSFDLPRPMPHSIRQSYLNCAGDLFRPEGQ
jgi:hypothetical protein